MISKGEKTNRYSKKTRENILYLKNNAASTLKVPGKINNKSNTMTQFHENVKL